jgi:hypothetical protein
MGYHVFSRFPKYWCHDAQHNDIQNNDTTLSIKGLYVIFSVSDTKHNLCGTFFIVLMNVIMLSVIMLSVIVLSVVTLNVLAPA